MPRKPKQHCFIDGVESKGCGKCKEVLPLSQYTKNKGLPDGLRIRCKKCSDADSQKYRQDNPEKFKQTQANYRENYRDSLLPKKREYAKQSRKDNGDVLRARELQYQQEHRQEARLRVKLWHKTPQGKESKRVQVNKRRSSVKGLPSDFTTKQWKDCKQHFNNKCAYCEEETTLQQDHFIPQSAGGEYTVFNMIPACQRCNYSKNRFDPFKWFPSQPFYTKKREQKILDYLKYESQLTLTI